MARKTKTQRYLIEMLKENTGTHFLDSGGTNGRAWQSNQSIEFMQTEPATWEKYCGLSPTISLFWYLSERLEFATEQNRELSRLINGKWSGESWNACLNLWVELMGERGAKGIYGEGEPLVDNTCNTQNNLSQEMHYGYYEFEGTGYVIISIRGGADVRGGYGRPRIFESNGHYDMDSFFDFAHAGCYCDKCESGWYSDDGGYHWYPNNDEPEIPKEITVIASDEFTDSEVSQAVVEYYDHHYGQPDEIAIRHNENGSVKVYCPVCGNDLEPSMY